MRNGWGSFSTIPSNQAELSAKLIKIKSSICNWSNRGEKEKQERGWEVNKILESVAMNEKSQREREEKLKNRKVLQFN